MRCAKAFGTPILGAPRRRASMARVIFWSAATLVAGAGASAPAAGQDVSGVWDVRWAQAVRVYADGSVKIQRWGDAGLALTQEGSRVRGTWTTDVRERVQWRVEGTFVEGRLTLVATEHDSTNEELAIVERILWDGVLQGDSLEGHVQLVIRGRARPPGLRPFRGVRREEG